MLGGYCGGPEGTALVGMAYHIQGLMVNQASLSQLLSIPHQTDAQHYSELLWGISLVYQALARNTL